MQNFPRPNELIISQISPDNGLNASLTAIFSTDFFMLSASHLQCAWIDSPLTHSPLNRPKPPVRIHVPSTACDLISFNGQGQLCPLTCAEWRDLSNHTRMRTIQSRKPDKKSKNQVTLTRKFKDLNSPDSKWNSQTFSRPWRIFFTADHFLTYGNHVNLSKSSLLRKWLLRASSI